MSTSPRHRYFVTGTDTGVGKTLASAALLRCLAAAGLRAVGMKPVAAGAEWADGGWRNEDVTRLEAAGNVAVPTAWRCPILLRMPASPHLAAQAEGRTIELAPLLSGFERLCEAADAVVVEGVGGFRVPLSDTLDTADLAVALRLPVILVVGLRLGCLNHALLSAEAIRARGLRLAGWIANAIDPAMLASEANVRTLCHRLDAPLLGVVPHLPAPDPTGAASCLDLRALGVPEAAMADRQPSLSPS